LLQRNSAGIPCRHENAALRYRLRPNRVEPLPGSRVIQPTLPERLLQASHMCRHVRSTGFAPPVHRGLGGEHRTVALAELVASLALAASTLIAATVVSIGIARADVAGNVIDNEGGLFVVALVLGLLFIGMGGLTILSLPQHPHKKSHS